jgi:tRNA-binding EMAP/Myf-like protein
MQCSECSSSEIDTSETPAYCLDCGTEVPEQEEEKPLIIVARIISVEAVPKKDKLSVVTFSINDEDSSDAGQITVVTNVKASTLLPESLFVVALPGAVIGGSDEAIKKTAVGGVMSNGMICNCDALRWKGGAAVAKVQTDAKPGDPPPAEKPRLG